MKTSNKENKAAPPKVATPTKKVVAAEYTMEEVKALMESYEEHGGENFSALIMGEFGAGKTTLCCTGRLPVLIDSFDPRGTKVLAPLIAEGKVLVRSYWDENSDKPTEFRRWEKNWERSLKTGFMSKFGTYVIDSGTTLTEALTNYIASTKSRDYNLPAIQDYQRIYNVLRNIVKMTSAQIGDTDFIFTGHLVSVQDELTSAITCELDTYKRLKSRLPILFTEKYVIDVRPKGSGVERYLLTQPKGRYRASTQLAGLDREEEPNLKVILRKAGRSVKDKDYTWLEELVKEKGGK